MNRKLIIIFLLGFSSGIPLALVGSTLQAWMTDTHVDIKTIGLFTLVGWPYALKFFWAPALDRFAPPNFPTVFGSFLASRQRWILLSQIALAASIGCLAFLDPSKARLQVACLAALIAFFSASQDIVIDAYRTDITEQAELGPSAAAHITGYRIAMLVSGAGCLILADRYFTWQTVYLIMAGLVGVSIFTTLLSPRPKTTLAAPKTLKDSVILPLVNFFEREGAIKILAFIILYNMGTVIATSLMTPFMLTLGFTKTDIGAVTKVFGLAATITGTLGGGALMVRLGIKRSLLIFGLMQGLSALSFLALSNVGKSYPMLIASIATENFCSGMGQAAFMAYLMSLCDKRFTATQYALFTSFMALTRVIAGPPTGFIAKTWGWNTVFIVSTFMAIPGLMLIKSLQRSADCR